MRNFSLVQINANKVASWKLASDCRFHHTAVFLFFNTYSMQIIYENLHAYGVYSHKKGGVFIKFDYFTPFFIYN